MSSTKLLSRLIVVFLVSFSLSACSYIPWVGGNSDEVDDLGFESDAPFGGAASDSGSAEDDFFSGTGDDQEAVDSSEEISSDEGFGFASVDQVTDQSEIRADLENLQGQQEALISKVRELQEMIDTLEPRISATQETLEGNLGNISEKADFLEPEVNELKDQMAQLQQELAELKQIRSTVSGRSGSSSGISSSFKNGYDEALAAYKGGNYDESILLFQNLEVKSPPISYQDNISFWIGSNYLQLEMYDDAIQAFQVVLAKYPRGNKVHDSRFQLGVSYQKKGDTSRAVDILETALRGDPPAEIRTKVEQRLREIQ